MVDVLARWQVSRPGADHTHTSMPPQCGKYDVPEWGNATFVDAYIGEVVRRRDAGLEPMNVNERLSTSAFSPVFDLDLKRIAKPGDGGGNDNDGAGRTPPRDFDEAEAARAIVAPIAAALASVASGAEGVPHTVDAVVMFRPTPRVVDGGVCVKDGVHVLVEGVHVDREELAVLTRRAVGAGLAKDAAALVPAGTLVGAEDDIVDACYSKKNSGWQMYGSSKAGVAPYQVAFVATAPVRVDVVSEDVDLVAAGEGGVPNADDVAAWVARTRVRDVLNKKPWHFTGDADDEVIAARAEVDVRTERARSKGDGVGGHGSGSPGAGTPYDIARARIALSFLKPSRSVSYEEWRTVGCALRHTSVMLEDAWLEFSARCSSKFDKNKCLEAWHRIGEKCGSGGTDPITLGTLMHKAYEDAKGGKDEVRAEIARRLKPRGGTGDKSSMHSHACVEVFDRTALRKIVGCWETIPLSSESRKDIFVAKREVRPLTILKGYLADSDDDGTIAVAFTRSKRQAEAGRQNAVGYASLQTMPREIRNTIAHRMYHDIGVDNMRPRLLAQYCVRKGILVPVLQKFCERRVDMLDEIVSANAGGTSGDRDGAERTVLSIMGGKEREYSAVAQKPTWLVDFACEMRNVHGSVSADKEHQDDRALFKGKKLRDQSVGGAVVDLITSKAEDSVVVAIMDTLAESQGIPRSTVVPVYDGVLVRRGFVEVSPGFLASLEAKVLEATKFVVDVVERSMDEVVDISGADRLAPDVRWYRSRVEIPEEALAGRQRVVISRPRANAKWSRDRAVAVFQDAASAAAFVDDEARCGGRRGGDLAEVLESRRAARIFFKLYYPASNRSADDMIEQFARLLGAFVKRAYPGIADKIDFGVGGGVQACACTTSTVVTVRIVVAARVPSIADALAFAKKVEDYAIALRDAYPKLVFRQTNGTWTSVVDLEAYSELRAVCLPDMRETGRLTPMTRHKACSHNTVDHLVSVTSPNEPAIDVVAGGTARRVGGTDEIRRVCDAGMRPFTIAETRRYGEFLDGWHALPDLFGVENVSVQSVGSRDGYAWVVLDPETTCPYAKRSHNEGGFGAVCMSVDDARNRATVVCEHPTCEEKQRNDGAIVVDGAPFSFTNALDGVHTSTLHSQARGIMWAEDYCEPNMRPIPPDPEIVCIVAQMGIGKSKAVTQHLESGAYGPRSTVLAVSFSIELCKKTNVQLSSSGLKFTLYKDVEGPIKDPPRVTVCLDSIERVKRTDFDLVIVDEVQSVIGHFNSKYMDQSDKTRSSAVAHKFEHVLRRAKRIILVDAAADSTSVKIVVDHLERLRKQRAYWIRNTFLNPTNRVATISVSDATSDRKLEVASMKFAAIHRVFNLLARGDNVVFVCNLKRIVVELEKTLAHEVERGRLDPVEAAFYYGGGRKKLEKHPDEEWKDLRLLAYSPTISAGISYEGDRFHSLVAYVDNSSYAPSIDVVTQMLYRVRNLKTGEMSIFFQDSAGRALDAPYTVGGVSNYLLGGNALERHYLFHTKFEAAVKYCDATGTTAYDLDRISWYVLVGFLVTRSRSLANGLEILQETLKVDYGVRVRVRRIDEDCALGQGGAIELSDIVEAVKADPDVPFEDLDLELDGEKEREILKKARDEGGDPVAMASVRLNQVRTRFKVARDKVDKQFYERFVVAPQGVDEMFRVRRWLDRCVKDSSQMRERMDELELVAREVSDPNLTYFKRSRKGMLKSLVGQEMLEALLDADEIRQLEEWKTVTVKDDRVTAAVGTVLDKFGRNEVAQMKAIFGIGSTLKGGNVAMFSRIAKVAFGLLIVRASTCPERPLYTSQKISARWVKEIIDKYDPFSWGMDEACGKWMGSDQGEVVD